MSLSTWYDDRHMDYTRIQQVIMTRPRQATASSLWDSSAAPEPNDWAFGRHSGVRPQFPNLSADLIDP